MKVLVVYDSIQGNTEAIARAVAGAFGEETRLVKARTAGNDDLSGIDLLVAGAPTHGGRPTPDMLQFLARLKPDTVKGIKAAAFDTRLSTKWVGIFGYAAGRIGKTLGKMGAELAAEPEPFFVVASDGPLKDGEEARAAAWAGTLLSTV